MKNSCLLMLIATLSTFGCTTTPTTGYYRRCGESSDGSHDSKIVSRTVELKGIPTERTFYSASEKGTYLILLRPEDLLRYLEHHPYSERLREQITSDLPLRDFVDINKYRLSSMIEYGEDSLDWGQIYSIAEMLENGDATVIDLSNDRNRHGVITKITVASIRNRGGEFREFCINDDDNFNTGWPIYFVADAIYD